MSFCSRHKKINFTESETEQKTWDKVNFDLFPSIESRFFMHHKDVKSIEIRYFQHIP